MIILEVSQTRNLQVSISIILLLFLVIITMYFRHKSKKNKLKEKQVILSTMLAGLGEKNMLLKKLGECPNEIVNIRSESIHSKEHFDRCFEETILKFQTQFTFLTKNELRYAIMFGMHLSAELIAEINNVQISTLRKVKQRIRSKLNIETHTSIEQYFNNYIS